MKLKKMMGLLLGLLALPAFAEESQFAYVYTTDLLPKGKQELEQWMTWRHEKAHGNFDLWQGRTSYEYGVSDNFQAAIYANTMKTKAFHDNVDGETAPPENFAELQPDPDEHFSASKFVGVSLEGIYLILSPYIHPIGHLSGTKSATPTSRTAVRGALQAHRLWRQFALAGERGAWWPVAG